MHIQKHQHTAHRRVHKIHPPTHRHTARTYRHTPATKVPDFAITSKSSATSSHSTESPCVNRTSSSFARPLHHINLKHHTLYIMIILTGTMEKCWWLLLHVDHPPWYSSDLPYHQIIYSSAKGTRLIIYAGTFAHQKFVSQPFQNYHFLQTHDILHNCYHEI